jgi:Protein of unknown function (DUF3892)
MIYITAVHMSPPTANDHQHIARLRWSEVGSQNSRDDTREQMISWINGRVDARVKDQYGDVKVGVVNVSPPYLRTFKDDRPTDNLLSLPRY